MRSAGCVLVEVIDADLARRMLTRLTIRNFKRFDRVEVELGNPVVFLGPNNSGKSTAMQALALWEVGLKRWNEKWLGTHEAERRPGVTLNRQDVFAIPVPKANLLWRNLHVRDVRRTDGRQSTDNVRIEIVVAGTGNGQAWECGLEFDYANEESFYCRPLRTGVDKTAPRMPVPEEAGRVRVAFLPPIAGLAATETRLPPGALAVRIGEGRTAEVLRNLCYSVHEESPDKWAWVADRIQRLFGVALDPPRYRPERGELTMAYRECGVTLDLSVAGRGLQQTLLLLSFMAVHPGSVLLLDEPDAHLELLRQRQTYRMIRELARESGCQIIAATHSEVLLNEAADQDLALAFVGSPHRIGRDKRRQVLEALRETGFEHYVQAEQTGWVLYLNSPTDLTVLQAFARRLEHDEAIHVLQRPFVHYFANRSAAVERHFQSLLGVLPALRGVALFDNQNSLDANGPGADSVACLQWRRRGIENYCCTRSTLEAYARREAASEAAGPLFAPDQVDRRLAAMQAAIEATQDVMEERGQGAPWARDADVRSEFLPPLFRAYRENLGIDSSDPILAVGDLVVAIPEDEIDPEIRENLDAIVEVAKGAIRGTPV